MATPRRGAITYRSRSHLGPASNECCGLTDTNAEVISNGNEHTARDHMLVNQHVERLLDQPVERKHSALLHLRQLGHASVRDADTNRYADLDGTEEWQH